MVTGVRLKEAREAIVAVCRHMYEHGLIAGADGNVSVRLSGGRLLVTPSGKPKGMLRPKDLLVVDMTGRVLAGAGTPSTEFRVHRLAYEERADVHAVVHAHPPYATGLTLAGVSLSRCVLPEACLVLGEVPVAGYTPPLSEEAEAVLRPFLRRAQVILLDKHGAIAVGSSLEQASVRMETLEHAAKILHVAMGVGRVPLLDSREVERLRESARRLGLPGPPPCEACGLCAGEDGTANGTGLRRRRRPRGAAR